MPPNILWIGADQQRYDTIGALNNSQLRSPNINRLVASGVSFERAYCQSPICTPSRSSFLTGMYPSSVHGCGNGNEYWAEAAPLVTALLADARYDCALAGKLHLAGAEGRIELRPQHDGYRLFHCSHGPHANWESGHDYADNHLLAWSVSRRPTAGFVGRTDRYRAAVDLFNSRVKGVTRNFTEYIHLFYIEED